MSLPSAVSCSEAAPDSLVLYRVHSRSQQARVVEAITWLGRPGLDAGRVERGSSYFVTIACDDATAHVLAEGFILGIDPRAQRVGP